MANPDFRDFDTEHGNKAKVFRRPKGGPNAEVVEKTANWPGLPGKTGPNRSAGVKRIRQHPKSEGL